MSWFEKKNKLLHENMESLHIEFNISSYCNLNCIFCPEKPKQREDMPFSLFRKSIQDLMEIDFNGLLSFSGFCEPTLHPEIENFVRYVDQNLNCEIILNTNGTTLDQNKIDVYENIGIKCVVVSAYSEEILESVKTIKSNIISIQDRFSDTSFINNRGGYFAHNNKTLNQPCYYPFYMIYIDYNGDVLFCCHNFNKKSVLGNVKNSSINDIINGESLYNIRLKLSQCKRYEIDSCRYCNVNGTKMGREQYKNWKERNIH